MGIVVSVLLGGFFRLGRQHHHSDRCHLGPLHVALQSERRPAVAALTATEAGVAGIFALVAASPPDLDNSILTGALSGLVQVTWVIGDSVRRRRAYVTDQAEQSAR